MSDRDVLVLTFVLVSIGIGLVHGIYQLIAIAYWPCANGKLHEAKVVRSGGRNYYAEVFYSYKVDGIEYVGDRLSFVGISGVSAEGLLNKQLTQIEYTSSGEVHVYYNPRKPRKSYLIKKPFRDFFSIK